MNKLTEWKNIYHKLENIDAWVIPPWTHMSYLHKLLLDDDP